MPSIAQNAALYEATMDGAEAIAARTATGWRVQLVGQTSWVLVSTGNPHLVVRECCVRCGTISYHVVPDGSRL